MLDLTQYNRVFTFGCSFTSYAWPTWADILLYDLEKESYNYGLSGLGNVGIMHRILEGDLRHKFTKNDCILICWSSWAREDRFLNGSWKSYGCVYNNNFYDKKFWKYCDQDNDLVKNSTAIIITNKAYCDKIVFQGAISDYHESEIDFGNRSEKYEELKEFYIKEISIPKNNFWNLNNFETYNNGDQHPTVESHLNYLKNVVKHQIKKRTEEHFLEVHEQFASIIKKYPINFREKIKDMPFWKSSKIGFK